ncbi:nitroreductase [Synechococcus sp. PCC 7502]|uniref:nitroreductase family protein n=1 Tax=Synechococcus sp. PCC 7502 TaxID=1173263 RepID=UPI00029FEC05|nr:nitroreductase family protein [Synechococcus sp. PCC 7502]AFY72675.1 nitroreductase [Synechococcus sp. PCC 7502]
MEKPAVTDYTINPAIAKRWSPRTFANTPVAPEHLSSLFEAARWSASCYNDQPWNFIVGTTETPDTYNQILDCLVPFNVSWAKSAPVLILAIARTTFSHNNKLNDWAVYDVGQAVGTLAVQATSLGLYLHQMAGFDPAKAVANFNLPENFKPVAAIALGYIGDLDGLPEDIKIKELQPRTRNPISSFVFDKALS